MCNERWIYYPEPYGSESKDSIWSGGTVKGYLVSAQMARASGGYSRFRGLYKPTSYAMMCGYDLVDTMSVVLQCTVSGVLQCTVLWSSTDDQLTSEHVQEPMLNAYTVLMV